MKFDIVIGNPPYQKRVDKIERYSQGLKVVYPDFVKRAIELSRLNTIMIIPARWYNSLGSLNLEPLSKYMRESHKLKDLIDFEQEEKVFQDVKIQYGVCIFNIDHTQDSSMYHYVNERREVDAIRDIDKYDFIMRDYKAEGIIDKVVQVSQERGYRSIREFMGSEQVFYVGTNTIGDDKRVEPDDIVIIGKKNKRSYIRRKQVNKAIELIDKYKVYISEVSGDINEAYDEKKVIPIIDIAYPGEVVTETYRTVYVTDDVKKAESIRDLMRTRLIRFIIMSCSSSIHLQYRSFIYAPMVENLENTGNYDNELYKIFGLSDEEIRYIETKVGVWENPRVTDRNS